MLLLSYLKIAHTEKKAHLKSYNVLIAEFCASQAFVQLPLPPQKVWGPGQNTICGPHGFLPPHYYFHCC